MLVGLLFYGLGNRDMDFLWLTRRNRRAGCTWNTMVVL
ncbi:hypothetical protein gpAD87_19755 [Paenibacillus sp. AD87]|nr:hypothetical protein gpAD87_19755 [Paenibacillus sp. AD87]